MKLKFSIVIILLSTCCLSGFIYILINRIGSEEYETETVKIPADSNIPKNAKRAEIEPAKHKDALSSSSFSHDVQIIKDIAAIDSGKLTEEIFSIRRDLEEGDTVAKLDSHSLNGAETDLAKAKLERLALLSLEGTRRKNISLEPELSDPVHAHRDSFKNIRHLLAQF